MAGYGELGGEWHGYAHDGKCRCGCWRVVGRLGRVVEVVRVVEFATPDGPVRFAYSTADGDERQEG